MCFAEWTAINQTFLLQEVGLSITPPPPSTPSPTSLVPPGTKPFHFTCPTAALNIISTFSCSDGLRESCAQIGAFYRKWVWLVEMGCLSVNLKDWVRECNHFTSTRLTLKYLFTVYTTNHWAELCFILLFRVLTGRELKEDINTDERSFLSLQWG